MNIKTGLRALTVAALLCSAGMISAGVANADDNPAPPMTRFINTATGECLTAHAQGQYVGMAPCNGSEAQNWYLQSAAGILLQDLADGNCMEVIPGSSSLDTVSCDFFNQNASQRWNNLFSGSPSTVVSHTGPCLVEVGSNALALPCTGNESNWYH